MREKEPESIALGLVDPRLNPIVASALSQANISTYDLEGCALYTSGVGQLAELLCQWHEDVDIALVRTLLQHPDILAWLDLSEDAEQLLRHLDRLFENAPGAEPYSAGPVCRPGLWHGPICTRRLFQLKQLAEAFTCADSFCWCACRCAAKNLCKKAGSLIH